MKFQFPSKFDWKINLLCFRNNFRVFIISSSTFQISKIHDNFSLDPFHAQEVKGGTLSPTPEKPKFSRCSISNQISGEGCICLVWVCYDIISSRNTPQCDLFMTQVDFMFFLGFWVQTIQALLNPGGCFPNSRILFLIPPNVCGKAKKRIQNTRNHILSLIFHLPIDSSPWFSRKNKVFESKTFSNLVFGDEFVSNLTIWIYHDLFHVLETKFQSQEVRMMF